MALDAERLEKPFLTLRKSLKKLSKQPSPEEVHDLRTRTRRVEAALHALFLDQKRKGQKVLEAITPVRKRAGKVRDMDVLIGLVSSLGTTSDDECRLRLIEYLGQRRFARAKKLHSVVDKRRNSASERLKHCSMSIERNSDKKGKQEWPADAAAISLQLSEEIRDWPKLAAKNLHRFRLLVKELRYVLELSGQKDELVKALGEVKDKIGDWHNWVELATIANDAVGHNEPCTVLNGISFRAQKCLGESLTGANRLRSRYFRPHSAGKNRKAHADPVSQLVLKAAARLAA